MHHISPFLPSLEFWGVRVARKGKNPVKELKFTNLLAVDLAKLLFEPTGVKLTVQFYNNILIKESI